MKTIKLAGNKGDMFVDDEDYEVMNSHSWALIGAGRHVKTRYAYTSKYFYPIGAKERKHLTIYAHRLVMNAVKGQMVDHIDGNGLNNQKSNLRFCTAADNQHNRTGIHRKKTSKYKGVCFVPSAYGKKWVAAICVHNKKKTVGMYATEEEAAKAYNKMATKLHGGFSRLNLLQNIT